MLHSMPNTCPQKVAKTAFGENAQIDNNANHQLCIQEKIRKIAFGEMHKFTRTANHDVMPFFEQ